MNLQDVFEEQEVSLREPGNTPAGARFELCQHSDTGSDW
jgi:hypothetical protein